MCSALHNEPSDPWFIAQNGPNLLRCKSLDSDFAVQRRQFNVILGSRYPAGAVVITSVVINVVSNGGDSGFASYLTPFLTRAIHR